MLSRAAEQGTLATTAYVLSQNSREFRESLTQAVEAAAGEGTGGQSPTAKVTKPTPSAAGLWADETQEVDPWAAVEAALLDAEE